VIAIRCTAAPIVVGLHGGHRYAPPTSGIDGAPRVDLITAIDSGRIAHDAARA
jgi:hypothetical protein